MADTNMTGTCTKCGAETGAVWKTLCRSCWKKQSPEEIRAYRQAKLDRRIARMKARAERLDKLSDQKQSGLNAHQGDIAFFTQPNIDSSKGRAFKRYRERLNKQFDAGVKLQSEADEIRKSAAWAKAAGVSVKGDAERKRQQEREERDKVFTVGSKVYDWVCGAGEIVRVNKKTYTIKFDSGGTYARDKSYIKL